MRTLTAGSRTTEAAINYYEKHIGDYIRDTVSLTMTEDGAYGRLMDQVYQSEKPLPLDKKMIYRLARASSTGDRKAVDFVLETFFQLTDEGYIQKRIQQEITRYQDKQRKAKASAEARWNRQKQDANGYANASQSVDGDAVEKTDVSENNFRASEKINYPHVDKQEVKSLNNKGSTNADGMRTHSEGNAHQTPDTKHQTQSIDDDTSGTTVGVASPVQRIGEICQLLRRSGVNTGPQALAQHSWTTNPGATNDLIETGLAIAKKNKPGQTFSVNYLRPIMDELLNPPAGKPAGPASPPKKDWL